MQELDKKFTDERVIIIKDDRAKCWSWWFEDLTEEQSMKHVNYTVVKAPYSGHITLRTVIQAMLNDEHYSDFCTLRDSHRFLEGFDKSTTSNIEYSCYVGN